MEDDVRTNPKEYKDANGLDSDLNTDTGDDNDDSGWDTDLENDEEGRLSSYDPHQRNKEKYIAACIECGVIPASYFLRNMNNARLNMAHHGLGENGVKALSIALLTNTYLTAVDLSDNSLGSEGVSHLCEMLMENCFVSDLDVSENSIGVNGVRSLCGVLDQTDTLKRLSLQGNSLEIKSSLIISNTMQHNSALRYLNLSHNMFGEEAGLHIAMIISQNESLEELDLSWNQIRLKGACAIAKSLHENITLKKLDLSWNGFGDDGIYVLSEALKVNGSLHQLNISSNRITFVGGGHLKQALASNEGLQVLKLGQNPLQHGTLSILEGVKTNTSSTILELDLAEIQVTNDFVNMLSKIQEQNPQLKVYHGGLGGSPQKSAERPKPMKVLRDHIKNNQMRVFDFFKALDKDKSMSISIPEFVAGLKETGVPLRHDELLKLVQSLDLDGDGEVDYKEMLIGHQESQKEERIEVLKEKADKARKRDLSRNLLPQTNSAIRKISNESTTGRSTPKERRSTTPLSTARPETVQAERTVVSRASSSRQRSKTFTH